MLALLMSSVALLQTVESLHLEMIRGADTAQKVTLIAQRITLVTPIYDLINKLLKLLKVETLPA